MSILNKLKAEAQLAGITPRTKEAMDWFRKRAYKMSKISQNKMLNEEPITSKKTYIGDMFFFKYDAKYKDELPYWDSFPLVFIVDLTKDGFYGINLHYIPPIARIALMDKLLDIKNNDKYDSTTRIKLSYSLLSGSAKYNLFKPCFKRYLSSHVVSKMGYVSPTEWEVIAFLPLAKWNKAKPHQVYKQSKKMV